MIRVGSCLDLMPTLDANSIDAIVTDPPYGLTEPRSGGNGSGKAWAERSEEAKRARRGGFMGKAWDAAVPSVPFWEAALRVAKPGAHLVAFGGTRTYHRLTCAIEDAGWEIRDCLSWLYGSGFPKSHNGPWGGTALKPAWEPIILARKPLVGTVAANVAAHGTGALNIDGCRIATTEMAGPRDPDLSRMKQPDWRMTGGGTGGGATSPLGRWPANVCLDEDAAAALDEQSGTLTSGGTPSRRLSDKTRHTYGAFNGTENPDGIGRSEGGASRFFYCAKASRAEREAGLEGRERKAKLWSSGEQSPGTFQAEGTDRTSTNHHPTVKPVALMRWLCRLVTPPGGLILDPFTGSGTTGVAAALEGFRFLGIEQEAEYAQIAEARIAHATAQPLLWSAAIQQAREAAEREQERQAAKDMLADLG